MIQRDMDLVRSVAYFGASVEHEETRALGMYEVFARRGKLHGKPAGDIRDGGRGGGGWCSARLHFREGDRESVLIDDLSAHADFGRSRATQSQPGNEKYRKPQRPHVRSAQGVAPLLYILVEQAFSRDSVGINRRGVVNERVIQRKA